MTVFNRNLGESFVFAANLEQISAVNQQISL